MTISNTSNRTSVVGSGATGQEVPFSFPITSTSDMTVLDRVIATGAETELAETTNYTIEIDGDSGGLLTTVTAIETTSQIHLIRNTPLTQSLDLEQGGAFNAENIEDAFDKSAKQAIDNNDGINRCLRLNETDPDSDALVLPNTVDRAGKFVYFDEDGNITAATSTTGATSIDFSDYGEEWVALADAAAARGKIGLDTDDDVEFADITSTDIITKGPWFDVRAYGGDGDGVTDNVVAINAATAAATAAGGGTVIFPAGHYLIDTKITVPKRVKLLGLGHQVDQFDAGALIEFSGSGFAIQTSNASCLENLGIISADDGVAFYGVLATIRDCYIYGANAAGSIGVQYSDGTLTNPSYYCALENCRVRKFKNLLWFSRYANGNYVRNGQVICNTAEGGMDHAIYIDGGNVNFIHCGIEGNCVINSDAIYLTTGGGTPASTTTFGNIIQGYFEAAVTGTGKKISINTDLVSGNDFYYPVQQVDWEDVSFANVKGVANRLHFIGSTQDHSSEEFYQSDTENILVNSDLNYAIDATSGIMPYGWAINDGFGTHTLSDEGTTLYGQKALKVAITISGAVYGAWVSYDVPDDLTTLIAGKPVTFGCWLKTSEAGAVKVTIRDVTGATVSLSSSSHTGGGGWEWLQATMILDSSATSDDIYFLLFATDQGANWNFEFAMPTVTIGRSIRETRPRAVIDDGSIRYGADVYNPVTLGATDTTPSVKNGVVFYTGGTTTITDFDDGVTGQEIKLIAAHTVKITNGTNILLADDRDWTMQPDDSLTLYQKADTLWYERNRSHNASPSLARILCNENQVVCNENTVVTN